MKEALVDRVENKKFDKKIDRLLFFAVFYIPFAIMRFGMSPEIFEDNSGFIYFFTIIFPGPLFAYLYFRKRRYGGQFIEWNENGIRYKAGVSKPTELLFIDILSIDIKLDSINFKLRAGSEKNLDIEDHQENEDRIRIKENFKKINTMPR